MNGNVYPEIEQYFAEYKYNNPRMLLRNTGGGRSRISARGRATAYRRGIPAAAARSVISITMATWTCSL